MLLLAVMSFALASCDKDEDHMANAENGHEWVDLGLPSGLKWATCNVGATKPEGPGNLYAWGETTTKDYYYWDSYQWNEPAFYMSLTKYLEPGECLSVDDDAAAVNWGGSWRMPTSDDWQELINPEYCTSEFIYQNGVHGRKFTSVSNGNSIFLPVVNCRVFESNGIDNFDPGTYWSSSLSEDSPFNAYVLQFRLTACGIGRATRIVGIPVRAVCK